MHVMAEKSMDLMHFKIKDAGLLKDVSWHSTANLSFENMQVQQENQNRLSLCSNVSKRYLILNVVQRQAKLKNM